MIVWPHWGGGWIWKRPYWMLRLPTFSWPGTSEYIPQDVERTFSGECAATKKRSNEMDAEGSQWNGSASSIYSKNLSQEILSPCTKLLSNFKCLAVKYDQTLEVSLLIKKTETEMNSKKATWTKQSLSERKKKRFSERQKWLFDLCKEEHKL